MKVGKLSYGSQSEAVEQAIVLDIMDTVRDWLAVLMENYKVRRLWLFCRKGGQFVSGGLKIFLEMKMVVIALNLEYFLIINSVIICTDARLNWGL